MIRPDKYRDIVRQENLLIFDDKYKTVRGFKEDLNNLLSLYCPKSLVFEDINLRARPRPQLAAFERIASEVNAALNNFDVPSWNLFFKRIKDFITRYSLGSEWTIFLVNLSLAGHFDVPDKRYDIRYDENSPTEACIYVTGRTTADDLNFALLDIKQLMPESKEKRFYAKAYNPVEDPDFVDAVKRTSLDIMNKRDLSYNEEHYLYDPNDLASSIKEIYKYRKGEKEVGLKATAKPPRFKSKMSDKEYFRGALKGVEITKATERLKKLRGRFQKKAK